MVQKQYITKRQKGKRSIEERAESINVHEETIKEVENGWIHILENYGMGKVQKKCM